MSTAEPTWELKRFEMVVLVSSLGGLPALSTVLAGLPCEFPAPLLVVQHGRRNTDQDTLTRLLRRATTLPVHTASTGLLIGTPGVTVIPGGCAATLDRTHRLRLTSTDGHDGGDTLLTSVATAARGPAIGVVLTGLLRDGAEGIRSIKRMGGRVLAQDPATARAGDMPSNALATGCVDFVLPLERIASALIALTMAHGAAELLTVPTPPWARLHTP